MPVESDLEVREFLGLERIAVIGCSRRPGKDAHEVPKDLLDYGYDIIPVNPAAEEVLGRMAYDSLEAVPPPIDIVQVFRPSEEVGEIVDAVLDRDDVNVLWLQLGITAPAATSRAEAAGIHVVVDRCMRTEHRRLVGS